MLNWKAGQVLPRIVLITVLSLFVGGVASATTYSWTTDDGTLSFTNDKKRIPERYRGKAHASPEKKLSGYDKLTQVPTDPNEHYAERLRERVIELRKHNRPAPPHVHRMHPDYSPAPQTSMSAISGSRGSGIEIRHPIDDASQPLIIESVPFKDEVIVHGLKRVRRGDRVIAIIKSYDAIPSWDGQTFEELSEID